MGRVGRIIAAASDEGPPSICLVGLSAADAGETTDRLVGLSSADTGTRTAGNIYVAAADRGLDTDAAVDSGYQFNVVREFLSVHVTRAIGFSTEDRRVIRKCDIAFVVIGSSPPPTKE